MNRLPELSYALSEARSTPLLAEFNAILNLGETFGPLLPLDAAITFYAPLRSSLADFRGAPASFDRASEGLYFRSGLWRIALDNNPRFGDAGLLMEPGSTNKITVFNAEPDPALTNYNLIDNGSGAILQRIADDDPLRAAGLFNLTNGYVVELDNRANTATALARCGGSFSNTNTHSISGFLRMLDGAPGDVQLRNSGQSIIADASGPDYEHVKATGIPTGAGNQLEVLCRAGARGRFLLLQAEEASAPSSPIITRGDAASRATDLLSYAGTSMVEDADGMIILKLTPSMASASLPDDWTNWVLTMDPADGRFLFLRHPPAGDITWRLWDGVNARVGPILDFSAGDQLILAARWQGAGMQCGYRGAAPWEWASEGPYDGSWLRDSQLDVLLQNLYPFDISEITIYNEDRGTEWIEENYP